MPFRAGYPSADFHSALAKPREGLTDMVLSPERRRSGVICLHLLDSELSERIMRDVPSDRKFPMDIYSSIN